MSQSLLGSVKESQAGDFLRVVYEPRGACREVIVRKDPSMLIEGPAGTGKSRAVLTKVHMCLSKYPGARALLTRKSRVSMTETILVTYERDVLLNRRIGESVSGRANRTHYDYPNGSVLVVGGCEDADAYKSSEFDLIFCEEATEFEESDVAKLSARLDRSPKMPYNQIVLSTNPDSEDHWLNMAASEGRFVRLLSRHEDNPSVTPQYLARLKALPPIERARLYEGKWVGRGSGTMVFGGEIVSWLREQARALEVVRGGSTVGALVLAGQEHAA